MVMVKPENNFAVFYYRCMEIARLQEKSLYEFYVTQFENLCSFGLTSFVEFLIESGKIEESFGISITTKMYSLGSTCRKLEFFKEFTNLSEEDVCFLVNYYLTSVRRDLKNRDGLFRFAYIVSLEENPSLLALAKSYPQVFEIEYLDNGDCYVKEKDNFTKNKWNELFIVSDGIVKDSDIAEAIYLLEDLNTDELMGNAISNLKKLLKKRLNIIF